MAQVTIYHNPNCSTSKHALAVAEELGVDVDVVQYLQQPLDAATLAAIADKLEDPVTDLVRRDATWEQLGLRDEDVATREQVIDVLTQHPKLLQRPILVRADRAIIGRPKERVRALLS